MLASADHPRSLIFECRAGHHLQCWQWRDSISLEWLQWGFEAYVMTDLYHDLSGEVSQFVVPDGWHATCVTIEGVFHSEGLAACALARKVGWLPV